MPNYHYKCKNIDCCDEFQTYQSIKDDSLIHCGECHQDTLERVLHAATICTKSEPKTLGHLADRNRDKMGRYEYQEKNHKLAERKQRGKKQISDEAKAARKAWGRPEATDRSLANMTAKQKKDYILKGETPE
jgi:putative FmdB family regulatory protein